MAKKKTNKRVKQATRSSSAKRSSRVSTKKTRPSAKKASASKKHAGPAKRKAAKKATKKTKKKAAKKAVRARSPVKRGGNVSVPARGKTAKRAAAGPPPRGQSSPPSPDAETTNGDNDLLPEPVPKIKPPLSAKELREFKKLLMNKRRALVADVDHLTREALGSGHQDRSANLSTMPIHMADLGSDNWEQEFTLGLIANEKELVRDIDDALDRIADRTYGVCLSTYGPISLARLRAKPWARYGIEYARQRDGARGR